MDVGWMAELDDMDRRAMQRDLDAAIDRARVEGDSRLVEDCLRGWEMLAHIIRADRAHSHAMVLLEPRSGWTVPGSRPGPATADGHGG
jgi:hypothetical protein